MTQVRKVTYDRNRLLGKGGYGAVFLGMLNGKEVAVKRIEHHNRSDDKEEKALRILDHPNVIKIFATEDNDDFRWIYYCNNSNFIFGSRLAQISDQFIAININ